MWSQLFAIKICSLPELISRAACYKNTVCAALEKTVHITLHVHMASSLTCYLSLCVARKWAESIKEPCAIFKVDSQGMCNLQSGLPGKYGFNCSSVCQYIQVKPVCLPVAHALKVCLTLICFQGGMQFACEMGHFRNLHTWK